MVDEEEEGEDEKEQGVKDSVVKAGSGTLRGFSTPVMWTVSSGRTQNEDVMLRQNEYLTEYLSSCTTLLSVL